MLLSQSLTVVCPTSYTCRLGNKFMTYFKNGLLGPKNTTRLGEKENRLALCAARRYTIL